MIKIPLTRNKFAFIDNKYYKLVSRYSWYAAKRPHTYYAIAYKTGSGRKNRLLVCMHRLIMGLKHGDKKQVDHVDGNGLDNRRKNLRIVTNQQNQMNSRKHKGSSRYKGVCWHIRDHVWCASIRYNYKVINIGSFAKEIEAAIAYDKMAKKIFGKYAFLNFKYKIK